MTTNITRQASWENIGTDIHHVSSVSQALKASALDYQVEKVPVFLGNGTLIKDQFATKKVGSNEIFGWFRTKKLSLS